MDEFLSGLAIQTIWRSMIQLKRAKLVEENSGKDQALYSATSLGRSIVEQLRKVDELYRRLAG